jgi:hypothetical protein
VAFRPAISRGLALPTIFCFKLRLLYTKAISVPNGILSNKLLISKEDI